MATVTWWVADLVTGDIRDRVRADTTDLEHAVAQPSQTTATMPIKTAPAGWDTLFDPADTLLVPVADYRRRDQLPLGPGFQLANDTYGDDAATLTLESLEQILTDTEVPDASFTNTDEAQIAAALVNAKLGPGTGWEFNVEAVDCGRRSDRNYTADSGQSLADALNTLMAADGGPEWTTRIRWRDADRTGFTKHILIGPRVGTDLPDLIVRQGIVNRRTRTRDASGGKLALIVTATANGETYTVQAGAYLKAGQPPREVRLTVEIPDDVADPDVYLARYAQKAIRARVQGITTWAVELDATLPSCPRVGVDFGAGDSVRVDLGPWGRRHNEDTGRDYWLDLVEWRDMARLSGWRATVDAGVLTTVTPLLYDDRDGGDVGA